MDQTKKANRLKHQLASFLGRIKQLAPSEYDLEAERSIYQEFRDLKAAYSGQGKQWILDSFSPQEVKQIRCLELGLENNQPFREVVSLMEKDNETVVANVVGFVKSERGRQAIVKNNLKELTDAEAVEFFGGVFGVSVAGACLSSLKAEKLGSILAYALSGRFQYDLQQFTDGHASYSGADLTNMLERKIAESDASLRYTETETPSGRMIEGKLRLEVNRLTENEVRGRNRADHGVYNPWEDRMVVGLSTSSVDVSQQKNSHAKVMRIANEVAKHQFGNTTKVEAFALLTGRFPGEEADGSREGRIFREMIEKGNGSDTGAVRKVLQMSYLSLYGNQNSAEQVELLAKWNPFIAGCDTLDIYLDLKQINQLEGAEKNKALRKMVTGRLTEAVEVLNRAELRDGWGSHTLINQCMKDILGVYRKLPGNFPEALSQREWQTEMAPLNKALEKFQQKMSEVALDDALSMRNEIRQAQKLQGTVKGYNAEVEETMALVGPAKPVVWVGKPKLTAQAVFTAEEILRFGAELQREAGNWMSERVSNYLGMVKQGLRGVPMTGTKNQEGRVYGSEKAVRGTQYKIRRAVREGAEESGNCGHQRLAQFFDLSKCLLWDNGHDPETLEKHLERLFTFMRKVIDERNGVVAEAQSESTDVATSGNGEIVTAGTSKKPRP